jgi:hypothetical protein
MAPFGGQAGVTRAEDGQRNPVGRRSVLDMRGGLKMVRVFFGAHNRIPRSGLPYESKP